MIRKLILTCFLVFIGEGWVQMAFGGESLSLSLSLSVHVCAHVYVVVCVCVCGGARGGGGACARSRSVRYQAVLRLFREDGFFLDIRFVLETASVAVEDNGFNRFG
jgi:hypothetical protein